MKQITSIDNPTVKLIASLHDNKDRAKHKLFIVEGLRALEQFFHAGWECDQLMLTTMAYDAAPEWFRTAAPITIVNYTVLKKISSSTTPSGFLGVFKQPKLKDPVFSPGLVLYNICDPGNLGTLIRTSVALNTSCILIEGCDPWASKVVQASAGHIAHAQLIQTSWEHLKNNKGSLSLCALVVKDGKAPQELDLRNSLLIVGSEAHGLPDDVIKQCDQTMTIPMPGPAESLNAAVAGSIALYLRYQACTTI